MVYTSTLCSTKQKYITRRYVNVRDACPSHLLASINQKVLNVYTCPGVPHVRTSSVPSLRPSMVDRSHASQPTLSVSGHPSQPYQLLVHGPAPPPVPRIGTKPYHRRRCRSPGWRGALRHPWAAHPLRHGAWSTACLTTAPLLPIPPFRLAVAHPTRSERRGSCQQASKSST